MHPARSRCIPARLWHAGVKPGLYGFPYRPNKHMGVCTFLLRRIESITGPKFFVVRFFLPAVSQQSGKPVSKPSAYP